MVRRTSNTNVQQGIDLLQQGSIQNRSLLWKIQGTVAVGFLALVFSACAADERTVVAPVSPSPAPAAPASPVPASPTVASPAPASPTASPVPITRPLTELVGQNVTVSTKVQRVITPNLFTVYDVESLRGQTVLVVSKNPAPPVNTNIEMTGVVRNLVVADVEREYGIDLGPEIEREYVNKPFIAAVAIERVD